MLQLFFSFLSFFFSSSLFVGFFFGRFFCSPLYRNTSRIRFWFRRYGFVLTGEDQISTSAQFLEGLRDLGRFVPLHIMCQSLAEEGPHRLRQPTDYPFRGFRTSWIFWPLPLSRCLLEWEWWRITMPLLFLRSFFFALTMADMSICSSIDDTVAGEAD